MADSKAIEEIADLLKVLGHPLRLKIINLVASQEFAVGEIENKTGISQPTLSQQLAIVRNAGLVKTRRESKQVYYSLDTNRVALICDTLGWIRADDDAHKTIQSKVVRQRKLGSGATFAEIL